MQEWERVGKTWGRAFTQKNTGAEWTKFINVKVTSICGHLTHMHARTHAPEYADMTYRAQLKLEAKQLTQGPRRTIARSQDGQNQQLLLVRVTFHCLKHDIQNTVGVQTKMTW